MSRMGVLFAEPTVEIHVNSFITDYQLMHLSEESHLHGMHKPYKCDFAENRQKLIDKNFELAK